MENSAFSDLICELKRQRAEDARKPVGIDDFQ
jgi:hypothetical protein